MEIINAKQLEELLDSKDFFSKIILLNKILSLSTSMTSITFDLLKEVEANHTVSEVIFGIINNAKKLENELTKLYHTTSNEDLRFNIAVILIETGNLSVKNDLVKIVREGEINKATTAAFELSKFKIEEAIEPIQNRLLSCTEDQMEHMSSLIDSLGSLGGKVPRELKTKLSKLEIPWHLKSRLNS